MTPEDKYAAFDALAEYASAMFALHRPTEDGEECASCTEFDGWAGWPCPSAELGLELYDRLAVIRGDEEPLTTVADVEFLRAVKAKTPRMCIMTARTSDVAAALSLRDIEVRAMAADMKRRGLIDGSPFHEHGHLTLTEAGKEILAKADDQAAPL